VLPVTAVHPIPVFEPLHIVLAEPAHAAGFDLTVITTEFELVHVAPPTVFVSVTVYVVVALNAPVFGFAAVEVNPVGLLVQA
jgi:hypothetical protein